MATKNKTKMVEITPINEQTVQVVLIGRSPLVTQPFSQKQQRAIEEKHAGKVTTNKKRKPRDPKEEFESAIYRLPDGRCCLKACAIKAAMINACSFITGMTKVLARGAFFVKGEDAGDGAVENELIPIVGNEPIMRTDPVRVGGKFGAGSGSIDLRYRPQYTNWGCVVTIEFDADSVTYDQLIQVLNRAGFSVGLHEMRPEKTGMDFGRFRVGNMDELKKLQKVRRAG